MPPKKTAGPPSHPKSDAIKPGTTFLDNNKRTVTVGKELAQGGFGRICDVTVDDVSGPLIGKFEPGGNGPLFVEQSVFTRVLRKESLDKFVKSHKLDFLGLPYVISNGMYNDIRYLVMPKYSYCLDHVIKKMGCLPIDDVKKVLHCVLNSLEYLHLNEHAHADVKAGNLMMNSEMAFGQVYLIDFGLCMRADKAVEKENKKRAHNGTPFFTSTDAHRGIGPTYRGDIETLGHNMVFWMTGEIPWEKHENSPDEIFKAKKALISNFDEEAPNMGINENDRELVSVFFKEASRLGVKDIPDFAKLHAAINGTAGDTGKSKDGAKDEPVKRSRGKKKIEEESSEEVNEEIEPEPKVSRGRGRPKKTVESSSKDMIPKNDGVSKQDAGNNKESVQKKKSKDEDSNEAKKEPAKRSRTKKVEEPEEDNEKTEAKASRGRGKSTKKMAESAPEDPSSKGDDMPNVDEDENEKGLSRKKKMKDDDSNEVKKEPAKRVRMKKGEEKEFSEGSNEKAESKVDRGKARSKKVAENASEETQPNSNEVSNQDSNNDDEEPIQKKKKNEDSGEPKKESVQKKKSKDDDSNEAKKEPAKRSRTKKAEEKEPSEEASENVEPKPSRGKGRPKKVDENVQDEEVPAKMPRIAKSKKAPVKASKE
ncbi:hypothetical protein FO519_007764 [Halicephalobus sp. NKZ332]|nr:hypothetical protein FO519_007764 [Halicephalobus sp. NKZ332]